MKSAADIQHASFLCIVNYLLLEALDTYAVACDDVTTSRDHSMTLSAAAVDIRRRLAAIFLLDSHNERPLHAGLSLCSQIPPRGPREW